VNPVQNLHTQKDAGNNRKVTVGFGFLGPAVAACAGTRGV